MMQGRWLSGMCSCVRTPARLPLTATSALPLEERWVIVGTGVCDPTGNGWVLHPCHDHRSQRLHPLALTAKREVSNRLLPRHAHCTREQYIYKHAHIFSDTFDNLFLPQALEIRSVYPSTLHLLFHDLCSCAMFPFSLCWLSSRKNRVSGMYSCKLKKKKLMSWCWKPHNNTVFAESDRYRCL